MIKFTWEKPSLIPSNVTHRYLQDNFLRFWFDKLTEEEILKLQKKLEEIDEYMENPKNIENFFEDSQWDFHKALAFHSGIQWVSYEWWEYGFFDEEGDPTLSDTQEIRVEYASKKMREALLQLSMNNTRGGYARYSLGKILTINYQLYNIIIRFITFYICTLENGQDWNHLMKVDEVRVESIVLSNDHEPLWREHWYDRKS